MSKAYSDLSTIRLLVIIGVIVFGFSGWAWWSNVHNSTSRVFWGMLDSSLAAGSVTRRINQGGVEQSADRYTRLQLGSQNASQVVETRKQTDGTNKTTIVQESIGTPSTDYISFPFISSSAKTADGKLIDYSKLRGVWGKTEAADSVQAPLAHNFSQAVLGTVLIGSLNPTQRRTMTDYMHNKKVYDVDFSKTIRSRENGKLVIIYPVKVDAKAYFSMLQQFAHLSGMGEIPGLDPSHYDGVAPLSVAFTVSVNSRQLTKIHYLSTNQDETFDSYGTTTPVAVPTSSIPVAELEKRIRSLQ